VGELRWKAPQAAAGWHGVRDASRYSPHCAQKPGYFGIESHTEDCLYLNVFRPTGDDGKRDTYPVMVWLHGGALHHGESNEFDPTRLVERGVVVVTLNYRVGAYGFMAHPALTAESGVNASGNYGLMDQQAALEWVKSNIEKFGGDKSNVTIFGQSAGALSVMSHLASPLAAGLFHKAIIQSGYQLDLPTLAVGEFFGTSLGTAAGCPTPQTAACLRALTTDQILNAQAGSYVPVVDGKVLPQSIRTAYEAGAFNKAPVIEGSTADEYTLLSAAIFDLNPPPAGFGPITEANYTTIQSFYLGTKTAAEVDAVYPLASFATPTDAIDAIARDTVLSCPGRVSAKLLSRHAPVYAYEFNDPDAPMGFLPPVRTFWGAFHAGDLQYVFDIIDPPQTPAPFTAAQRALADQMVGFWTQFAKTGNPNSGASSLWPQYSEATDTYLSLKPGGASAVTTDFSARHQCVFWTGS
jgi:para-nitrobenzyl esterase